MERIDITLSNLKGNKAGLLSLASFMAAVDRNKGKKIVVDCHLVSWVDAHLAAAMMTIINKLYLSGGEIYFEGLKPNVLNVLRRNGFFPAQGAYDKYNTSIPLRTFALNQSKEFSEYTSVELDKKKIPSMSQGVRQKIDEALDELFNNASIHSKSTVGVTCCGQFYPSKNSLDFTIVDAGVGIRENVARYLGKELSANEAISWAVQKDHTTRSGDIPGGIGLTLLQEFIFKNKGELTIYSDTGYWNLSQNGTSYEELHIPFVGTYINIEFNTADKSVYFLTSELQDPNSML